MRGLSLSRRGRGRGGVFSSPSSPLTRRGRRIVATAARGVQACSESLEPRLLLAAHTWIGGQPAGLNQLWSFGPNWTSGVAPAANESDVALVFPAFGIQKVLI